jgi:beta-glucosidase
MAFEVAFEDSVLIASRYNYRNELGDPRVVASPPVELEAGREYPIVVEASESWGDAILQLVWAAPVDGLLSEAVAAAREADAVVLFLGLTPRLEGEEMRVEVEGFGGGDRTDLVLPAAQQRLLEAVTLVGKPTVLVLLGGSALAVGWADRNVGAIVEAWYPGQAAGTAIADVLFGDYNPAGRLPVTFYRSVGDLPPFDDYAMTGRTYRFFEGEPLYAFGHGLSYTSFGYENLKMDGETLAAGGSLTVSVDVTNTGQRAGEEVVQLYVRRPESAVDRPVRDLRGFRRVALGPGETTTVAMTLEADALRHWDPDADAWALEPGPVLVQVGASSADLRVEGTIRIVE